MLEKQMLFTQLIIIIFGGVSAGCDVSSVAVTEGLLGQSADFMWLGVLQVYIRDFDKRHVAMSGIVLIKPQYALGNADDVARIPERVFREETVAVFIRATNTPYAVSVLSYTVHPEYEHTTMHSLAVVELDVSGEAFQLIPVCLPPQRDTPLDSQPEKLYLIGYTDEHKALEKVIYGITPLKDKVCDEYNERTGVTEQSNVPTASVCGYAPYSSIKCQWDDGMALVSNATNGVFTLMGLSIHGPGCTAPARYIALSPYVSWLRLVTGSDADSPQLPPQPDQPAYIPAHKLFTSNETRRTSVDFYIIGHDFIPHQTQTGQHNKGGRLKNFYIKPIERDSKTLAIYPIEDLFEISPDDCNKRRTLMYREDIFVTVPESRTEITYKLELYDLRTLFCKCITLKVKCFERSYAYLSFREEFDFVEGTEDLQTIRFEVNKYGSMPIRTAPPGKKDKPKKLTDDQSNYKPKFITFDTKKGTVLSNQLYLRFWFAVTGKLELKMYGAPIDMNPYTLDTTTRAGHTEPDYHDPSYYLGGSIPQMMHRGVADTLVADVHEPVSAGRRLATTPLCVTVPCLLTITLSLNTLLYIR